jgi:hypothetical protein
VTNRGAAPFWVLSVFDLDARNSVTDIERLPVQTAAGLTDHAAAIKISRAASIDYLLMAESPGVRGRGAVRLAGLETDARMLFARTTGDGLKELALVDGSMAATTGGTGFTLRLPHEVPDLYVDVARRGL